MHCVVILPKERAVAVHEFSTNDDVIVLLISLRHGAAGLTLTSAQNVFFLDPAIDPATEEQAIGRAHRIGQTQQLNVVSMITLGEFHVRPGIDDSIVN